ncbi:MAG: DUF438 domain-containing protein [Candidatus Aquicultorales bacterium]
MAQPAERHHDRKEALKEMIRRLHAGEEPGRLKEAFKEFASEVTPNEITQIEEELIREGMPVSEVRRLCDVHLAVFQESIESEAAELAPSGHPVNTLMKEHVILLGSAQSLRERARAVAGVSDLPSASHVMDEIEKIVHDLKDSENHYLREENVLFPYLEKHGVTQPPAVMWMEHDRIREIKKNLYDVLEAGDSLLFQEFAGRLEEVSVELAEMLESHFYKENNILFPTALEVIEETEWPSIRSQFDDIGYCCFTPREAVGREAKKEEVPAMPRTGEAIEFDTGTLTLEQIEGIFKTLPVELTFVDAEDIMRFFTETEAKIFIRTKATIGRQVQKCHPQKSVHMVDRILDEFKSGVRDVAEFWLTLKGRLLHVRYFPVRNKEGEYLGCLEMVQDISEIKNIKGEKKLL